MRRFEDRMVDRTELKKKTTTKWHVRPAKTQMSLGIRPVWSESSLSAWRKLSSLATQWAPNEDWSDWADAESSLSILLVLSWGGSNHKKVSRWSHAMFLLISTFFWHYYPAWVTQSYWRGGTVCLRVALGDITRYIHSSSLLMTYSPRRRGSLRCARRGT